MSGVPNAGNGLPGVATGLQGPDRSKENMSVPAGPKGK